MKLIVQIPCFNEAATLPAVVRAIPRTIPGIERVEILVIDDGSSDRTRHVAADLGVEHIVAHTANRGLAQSFQTGLDVCLQLGADIVVNTDGDNQYSSDDIPRLVSPIVAGEADIAIGDRGVRSNPNFGHWKTRLQIGGSLVVRRLSGVNVPDAVSGFRALSANAIRHINIVSDFSYTIEMLIQAGAKGLRVVDVPIATNPKTRESRLFRSVPQFLRLSGLTLLRVYAMYKPLRVFFWVGCLPVLLGTLPILRFVWLYMQGQGDGHVQSLILGAALLVLGCVIWLFGLLADLIAFNRKLIEQQLLRTKTDHVTALSPVSPPRTNGSPPSTPIT